MSFSRTSPGLQNAARFYGVSAVVYVEGRPQTSESDPGSLDIIFWSKLFDRYAPNLQVRVICRGSKSDLLHTAAQITGGALSNVIVALDRDYDPEVGVDVRHPAVLYSYGYSWENDVWCHEVIEALIASHSLVRPVPVAEKQLVRDAFDDFCNCARRVARSNMAAALGNNSYVVRTCEHKGLVQLGGAAPKFRSSFFKQKLRDYNRAKVGSHSLAGRSVEAPRHILGHFMAFFGFHLACSSLRRLGQTAKVDFDFMSSLAIATLDQLLATVALPCSAHYENCIGGVPGA